MRHLPIRPIRPLPALVPFAAFALLSLAATHGLAGEPTASGSAAAAAPSAASTSAPPAAPKPQPTDGPRHEAQAIRKQVEELSARYAKAVPEVKEAADALVAARLAEAAALDHVVAAIEAGKPEDIKSAWAARTKAAGLVGPEQERLSAREAQQRNLVDDKQIDRLGKSTPDAVRHKLEALLEARKAAAQAWDAVAQASASAGPALAPLKERAVAAEGAARVAARDHEISCEIAKAQEEATRTGTDLSGPLAEARKVLEQAIDIEKRRAALDVAALKLEARRREVRESIRAGFDWTRKRNEDARNVEGWLSNNW